MPVNSEQITGVILAGGKGRRLGGQDKGLVDLLGRPLVAHVIDRLKPQTDKLLINANRNSETYSAFGYPVVADSLADFQGPLAGVAAALEVIDTPWMVTAPCDSPLLPLDMVARLADAVRLEATANVAVVSLGDRLQPVYALMHRSVRDSLQRFLAAGERRVGKWLASERMVAVDFSAESAAFENINTQQDYRALQQQLSS